MPIFETVETTLNSSAGRAKLGQVSELLDLIVNAQAGVAALRRHCRQRNGLKFYINPGNARDGNSLKISVRLQGLEVGKISVREQGRIRRFSRSRKNPGSPTGQELDRIWAETIGETQSPDWADRSVADFLSAVKEQVHAGVKPECVMEAGLITLLNRKESATKPQTLWRTQPILFPVTDTYSGFPFQFPMPIKTGNSIPNGNGLVRCSPNSDSSEGKIS